MRSRSGLVELLSNRLPPPTPTNPATLRTATVTAVGGGTVDVDLSTDEPLTGVRHCATYTPTVGDRVVLVVGGGLAIVVDKLAPNTTTEV